MAYQVISQNNTTTTLADENGNIIRVPARVSLATSTDYTIKKVNNSTATLEDGNGNIIRDVPCVAVLVGGEGGGSDPHNLGWYATQSALETAHPTAEDGDWAIVGSTDTVWVWDSDTNAWKDTDQKGQVESVNGQTGTVVLTASDVGAATTAQGAKADTAVQPGDLATVATTGSYTDLTNAPTIPAAQVNSDWNSTSGVSEILNKPTLATVATTGAYSDLSGAPTIPAPTQVSTLPTASVDELGNIYQFIGTTDANYTNGYFYECVSDGQATPTYSWTQKAVQPSSGGLPSQTGQSGKFLTTDGTDASWSDITKVNTTITLAAADWSSNTQTVTVNGVASTSVVFVAPDPADTTDYVSAGILCTSQATNSLTFTATTTPTTDIDVNVVCLQGQL